MIRVRMPLNKSFITQNMHSFRISAIKHFLAGKTERVTVARCALLQTGR